jgi:tetratricopeptide (TPR) repeat protein
MGRAAESIVQEKLALQLDPASLPLYADLGRVYFWARRYDEAVEQYRRASEMGADFGAFYAEFQYVYEQQRQYDKWFNHVAASVAVNEFNRAAFLARDWQKYVRATAEHGMPHDRAENYARSGQPDKAFEQLDVAYRTRDHRLSQLRVNPVWDPLRSDPRFQALVRRMNLQ